MLWLLSFLSFHVLWLTRQLLRCQIEVVRKSLYVVASYRGITVFTQEIRKHIKTKSSEYPIAIISEEKIVSRIDKNLITERPSFICVMHLP